jgi:D-glycero-alpha-D-manno-heptose-7-phosphate kinase
VIISRTPVRLSFLGGGTDYPAHFRQHGGQTLGVTIDKYSYVTVNRMADLFDHSIRVSYSQLELANHVDEIRHPAVRECLRYLGLEHGIEIHYVGDLPARTGLGSSSSFTVGLLHALHAFRSEMVSQPKLAAEAVYVEQELIGERVGVQDQYTCAQGGLVHLQISPSGHVQVCPIPLATARKADFNQHLMLLYTGMCRTAHEVIDEQLESTRRGLLVGHLQQLGSLVDDGIRVLTSGGPITEFGRILHEAWLIKRQLSSKTSNSQIDAYYELALRNGAIGGKLLGAGGGGFLLLVVEPDLQPRVEQALQLRRVHFSFEHAGTSILFYQPQHEQQPGPQHLGMAVG